MISFQHLTKRYGAVTAVDDVTFDVRPGTVCGFLGPNGAGKSTSLRCLVGLARPTSGRALVLGRPYGQLVAPASQVGTMLDASALHPGRTGLEILSQGAVVLGLPKARVQEVLDLVGLTSKEARRKVAKYSLGMRQRLGIGHALLGSPSVLVLDEPVNGLDPAGIRWMRQLLRDFADRGGTVLLSSHLLHEVQQVADQLVMIGHGRVVHDGPLDELLASGEDLEERFLQLTAATAREGALA
ncbi:ABC transporter ATP-binding protein [uncultured Tessaracoccus sp.]|uniref:ABC transporter ATP-binding protein n=1 Tax=uncultured Tessaracoccus sp. TaxID=905023 RepID=UPI0025DC7B6E|nr:ABC transporter ATP-binding protein [uncultured Tessaracoccus sp.]